MIKTKVPERMDFLEMTEVYWKGGEKR